MNSPFPVIHVFISSILSSFCWCCGSRFSIRLLFSLREATPISSNPTIIFYFCFQKKITAIYWKNLPIDFGSYSVSAFATWWDGSKFESWSWPFRFALFPSGKQIISALHSPHPMFCRSLLHLTGVTEKLLRQLGTDFVQHQTQSILPTRCSGLLSLLSLV